MSGSVGMVFWAFFVRSGFVGLGWFGSVWFCWALSGALFWVGVEWKRGGYGIWKRVAFGVLGLF
jgi:hypothetical protein